MHHGLTLLQCCSAADLGLTPPKHAAVIEPGKENEKEGETGFSTKLKI